MEIPKEVIVAIIAAMGALIVALLGLVSALKSAKETRQTQVKIEEIKTQLAELEERRARRASLIEKRAELISIDLASIQIIRDELRRLIDAPNNTIRMSDSKKSLIRSINALEENYKSHFSKDPSTYLTFVHEAKGISFLIIDLVEKINVNFTSEIDKGTIGSIASCRSQLQSIQERLRNEQMKMISELI